MLIRIMPKEDTIPNAMCRLLREIQDYNEHLQREEDHNMSDKKYQIAKDFTPMDFYEFIDKEGKTNCDEFRKDFNDWLTVTNCFYLYGSGTPLNLVTSTFRNMVLTRSYFREYLIKGGFIEEVKKEVFYTIRDKFKLDVSCAGESIYMLYSSYEGSGYRRVGLICIDGRPDLMGQDWNGLHNVADPHKITEIEFEKICSSGKFVKTS